jgi:amidohydrolase
MEETKSKICNEVDSLSDSLFDISQYLLDNPETAYQEVKACEHLSGKMEEFGFQVERGVGNVETAFLARPVGCTPSRPTVAIMAEYDALPKIGHGCGHNLIASASVGAAVALRRTFGESAGCIALVGTPAEEGGGGKVRLAEAGVFKEMDTAIMFHPSDANNPGKNTLGRIKFTMEFHGKTAHAAASPDQGLNALDAIVLAYTGINSLRQQLRPDGRIHGIITHGGDAPNIIPDYTAGLFYVRAGSRAYRDELFERGKKCAEGAALATGTEVKFEEHHPGIDPIKRNPAFETVIKTNMELLGITVDGDDGRRGSSDIGNLSHYLPAIHPFLSILDANSGIAGHSVGFRDATISPRGQETLLNAAKMLALTAYDYLKSEQVRESVTADFNLPE